MTFSAFSIAIIMIFATAGAICAYRCIQLGFFKSLIFLGCSLFGITGSIILSPIVAKLIMRAVFKYVLRQLAEYRDIVSIYPSIDATAEAVASAVVSALLSVLIFYILRKLSYLICVLIGNRAFKSKSDDPGYAKEKSYCERNSKKLGALMGIACAVLSTMVLTAPIMGILDIANTVVYTAEDIMPDIWENAGIEEDIEQIKKYSNDAPGNIFYRFGGQFFFKASASADFLGKRVYLMHEVDTVSNATINFSYVYTILMRPELSNSEYIKYVHRLCDNINDINISHALLADFIREEFTHWKNGESGLLAKPDISETVDYAFDCIVDACVNSTPNNIKGNISSFLRIYAIILDSNILKYEATDIEGILSCISDSGLIEKVNAELESNPSLSDVRFSYIAMSVLTKQIDDHLAETENYNEFKKNMAEAISVVQTRGYGSLDEKLSVLTSYTQEYIKDFGIDISSEMAKYNADVFLNYFSSGNSDIMPEDIEALLASFRAE